MKGGQRQNEYPKVGESGLKKKKNEGKKITRKKQQQRQQRTSSAKMPHSIYLAVLKEENHKKETTATVERTSSAKMPHSIYLSKHNLSDCHAPQPRHPTYRPLNPKW
eukprot:CAMPEP_0194159770 /NCGR_PEP_ID=MMETSP0152-20130528/78022_1 /TAXON_ID=1049557 /ORGANISM="Thalassiothrix antarctica, Strain L6-D1" /LENGTH=106 /DNA_ID=CAMNT_0038869387 /DNA_START=752 /DNA_END=1070 /DNA_ORIENTATION=+